jgi:hypothetical protein
MYFNSVVRLILYYKLKQEIYVHIPNDHKIYQMTTKYTQCHKMYQIATQYTKWSQTSIAAENIIGHKIHTQIGLNIYQMSSKCP